MVEETQSTESACGQEEPPIQSPRLAPPTLPGELSVRRLDSSWPHLIGVICMVIGVLGIFAGVLSIVGSYWSDWMGEMMNDAEVTATLNVSAQWRYVLISISVLKALLAGILVMTGILIARRKSNGRKWSVRYSLLQILFAFISCGVALLMQSQSLAELTSITPEQASASDLASFGAVAGFFWTLILPIFLLLWFRRSKIKQEVVDWQARA